MSGTGSDNGWLEAAVAWEVCASLHRQYCKGKDALFTTRQSDFVKHAETARVRASHWPAPATQQAGEVSDAMVLAALQMQHPAAYGQYLRHPANGPKTSIRTEAEIDTARRMIAAALAAAPQPSPTAQAADSVQEDAARLERERICAAIKAEDDYCVDHGDCMLDSDDCIKIVRGEWVRPDYSVDAARKQGATHDR